MAAGHTSRNHSTAKRNGNRAKDQRLNRVRQLMELIEPRLLLSAVLNGNALTVDGTNAGDHIVLSLQGDQIVAAVNSDAPQSFAVGAVSSITVNGLDGADYIEIGSGMIGATVNGGIGNDTLVGGTGDDKLVGGPDDDRYVFRENWGHDLVVENAGGGNDTLDFSGAGGSLVFNIGGVAVSDGHNTVNHGENNVENLVGGSGDNTFVFQDGAQLNGTIAGNGLPGRANTLMYGNYTAPVSVNLPAGTATGTAHIQGINNIIGGRGNDLLIGDANANTLVGGPGLNTLIGNGGADTFVSNNDGGTDTIVSPPGQGTLDFRNKSAPLTFDISATGVTVSNAAGQVVARAGAWVSKLVGGSGNDRFIFEKGAKFGGIVDGGAGGNTLDYSRYGKGVKVYLDSRRWATNTAAALNFDNVTGSSSNDLIIGNANANQLYGGKGNDSIIGEGGRDVIVAGHGNNLLIGGKSTDYIQAGNGKNTIFSQGGRDTIRLGNGRNTIYVGAKDRVIAGKGNNSMLAAGKGASISGKGRNTKGSMSSSQMSRVLKNLLKKLRIKA